VGAIAELHEAIPLEGGLARDGVAGLGDLLIDSPQRAAGPVVPVGLGLVSLERLAEVRL
jgi:hypothetical protein